MTNMRDRLISLLNVAVGDSNITENEVKIIAEYLLDNGVTVPSYKAGDTVYIIEYDDDGVAEDYTGYMFLAQTTNAVIVTPFINDYDLYQTVEDLIQETAETMDCDLCVFPLERCYATKEEAQKVLRESGVDNG